MNAFHSKLLEAAGSDFVKMGEPMKNHTTFRVGGPASWYVTPKDETALAAVVSLCRAENVPYYIIGNGSNLLVSDNGYEGVIVSMSESWNYCRIEGCRITAGAGALLSRIARAALDASLTGFEFAAGIPGTLGGAVVMNAGAYGSEMKYVLESARVLDREGRIRNLSLEELELGYRKSCILANGYIVLEAVLLLEAGDQAAVKARMDELAGQRREKQPLEYPSAGSTFKRPAGYFAGKLIQDAGLRGFRLGGAQVSEKHCGFVINRDHATAADVLNLCREVQRKVKDDFGVDLEMEVKMLGKF
ncbi:UDP-N-acetylmuramate dehydrogenase [Clostridium sp. MCC353]|uniref:UDP-N-acetylmuramate dehydrogenase n=1 Tax=Clostridium sp. MCC353 TaxID=2592646 RepID=UPI001C01958F|nr:UDP-N-acetylmuramate dehydrogenase [Clostridium sp. MCC353]MBT9778759.1 UDP-N-acetylmuramate dehydrogenase [Clostridium sp. MCC353]